MRESELAWVMHTCESHEVEKLTKSFLQIIPEGELHEDGKVSTQT